MTMMMMENFTYSKNNLFIEQITNHHHRRGQESLVVKLAAALKRKSSQVMDWAKRQALAHHAAEEKGPTSFSFPAGPIFATSLLSSYFLNILVTSAPANMPIKIFKETKSFKGIPHSSLGYTLAHMLIFSKLHKVRCMCSMSSVIICIADTSHQRYFLYRTRVRSLATLVND